MRYQVKTKFNKIQLDVDKLISICYILYRNKCCLKSLIFNKADKGKLLERVGRKASGPPQITQDSWAAEVKKLNPILSRIGFFIYIA
jgi:hypothetical protein